MTDPPAPTATVVVSPRDSFSRSLRCLDRLLECTPSPHRIVYVDGGSPEPIASALAERAREFDFVLIRSDCVLTPNQARNLGWNHVDTEWVAFVDNDVMTEPAWLETLVTSARETGAAAVVPLLCIGEGEKRRVHVAGGESRIVEADGGRAFSEEHPFQNASVDSLPPHETRRECTMFEFHTVLMNSKALAEVAPLDEGLRSIFEHSDLGLRLRELGGAIWYEPAVSTTYLPPRDLRGADRDFFLARWSDEWNRLSAERFIEHWQLSTDDERVRYTQEFGAWIRVMAYRRRRTPLRWLAARKQRVARPVADRVGQRRALQRYHRSVVESAPPRLVHRASWLESSLRG